MKNLYYIFFVFYTIVGSSQNTYLPDWVIKQEPIVYHINQDFSDVYISSERDTIFYGANTYNGTSTGIKYKLLPDNTEHTLVEVEEGTTIHILHRDQQGNFYIAGLTTATENFATPNVYKSEYETNDIANTDGYIAKYSSNGQLLWRTYTFYVGTGGFNIKSLTTDGEGNVYFAEYIPYNIVLENAPFQSTATLAESVSDDHRAPAITKLNSEGQLVWSTFYCNHRNWIGKLVTTENRLWVAGCWFKHTDFTNENPNFYTTLSSNVPTISNNSNTNGNLYLSAFDFDGNRTWSTYLTPGISLELKTLQASANKVYVLHGNNNFPLLENSAVWGNTRRMSTFNENGDWLYTLTTDSEVMGVDANEHLFFVGKTQSTAFPVTADAYQTEKTPGLSNGVENYDAYVQIVNESATENIYSSYFGKSGDDNFTGIFPYNQGYYAIGTTENNYSNGTLITSPPYLDPQQDNPLLYRGDLVGKFKINSLSISDTEKFSLSIYPNPTAGQLTLSLAEDFVKDFSFEWYNLQGQKIPLESQQTTTEIRWNLESLATGVYLLKVSKGKEAQQTFRIIKK